MSRRVTTRDIADLSLDITPQAFCKQALATGHKLVIAGNALTMRKFQNPNKLIARLWKFGGQSTPSCPSVFPYLRIPPPANPFFCASLEYFYVVKEWRGIRCAAVDASHVIGLVFLNQLILTRSARIGTVSRAPIVKSVRRAGLGNYR